MELVKVDFTLDIEDGYPPVGVETLNGIIQSNGLIKIDNAPFFAEEIAVGDEVRCGKYPDKKNYQFEKVVEVGGNKTVSVIFINDACKEGVYQYFRKIGCYCEYGEFVDFNMLAVDIDEKVDYQKVKEYLSCMESKGFLSYAELCV